eukprot:7744232-Pyramimonas_sp.AAC.1
MGAAVDEGKTHYEEHGACSVGGVLLVDSFGPAHRAVRQRAGVGVHAGPPEDVLEHESGRHRGHVPDRMGHGGRL